LQDRWLSFTLGKEISMKDTGIPIDWLDGSSKTVEIGHLNSNSQQCGGHCGVPGTYHGQYAYKTECTICGYVYGTNGTDMFEKRCLECQERAPGIRYLGRLLKNELFLMSRNKTELYSIWQNESEN
jgi:hypothetical protein